MTPMVATGRANVTLIEATVLMESRHVSGLPVVDAHGRSAGILNNGVVTLAGVISDERARAALRVAAQNVAGVTAVEDKLAWADPAAAGFVF